MSVPAISSAHAATDGVPRSGADLVRAARDFQDENRWTSWRLLLITIAVIVGEWWLILNFPTWTVQLPVALLLGLTQVRLFIFYHDTLHGAIFVRDPIARAMVSLVGVYLLAVRSVWQETHDFHHQNNARHYGSAIGTYPILPKTMEARLSPRRRRIYRWTRHRLFMLFGCLTVALGGMVTAAFLRQPSRHWGGPVAVVVHALVFTLVTWQFDWVTAVFAMLVPSAIAMAMGSYLFYAQHNFPSVKLTTGPTWSYATAALESSSMFDMSPLMHWFTGSIGYHHVHHLNHRIPFYRLRETMEAMPELQNPGRTSWRLRDILACLDLYVWDPEQKRMLTYAEAA